MGSYTTGAMNVGVNGIIDLALEATMTTSIQQRLRPFWSNATTLGMCGHSAHYNLGTHVRVHFLPLEVVILIIRGTG